MRKQKEQSGSRNSNWKGGLIDKLCSMCGKTYKVKPCHSKSRYCSLQCVGKSQKGKPTGRDTGVTKVCEICGGEYKVPRAHATRHRCCSKKCSFKLRSKIMSGEGNINWMGGVSRLPYPYNWLKVSAFIRKRDGHKCMNPGCNNLSGKGKMEAHHIDHDKTNLLETNLITLCSVCNSKANFNKKYWMKFYTEILKNHYPQLFKEWVEREF